MEKHGKNMEKHGKTWFSFIFEYRDILYLYLLYT